MGHSFLRVGCKKLRSVSLDLRGGSCRCCFSLSVHLQAAKKNNTIQTNEQGKWLGDSKRMLEGEGVRVAEGSSWTERGKSLLGVARTPRVENLINTAAALAEARGENLQDLFCDTSQSVMRKPWSNTVLRALNTSTEYYSFGLDRIILGRELFPLMGFPKMAFMATLGESVCKDLAGEAMSPPIMALLLVTILQHVRISGLRDVPPLP